MFNECLPNWKGQVIKMRRISCVKLVGVVSLNSSFSAGHFLVSHRLVFLSLLFPWYNNEFVFATRLVIYFIFMNFAVDINETPLITNSAELSSSLCFFQLVVQSTILVCSFLFSFAPFFDGHVLCCALLKVCSLKQW